MVCSPTRILGMVPSVLHLETEVFLPVRVRAGHHTWDIGLRAGLQAMADCWKRDTIRMLGYGRLLSSVRRAIAQQYCHFRVGFVIRNFVPLRCPVFCTSL